MICLINYAGIYHNSS